MSDPEARNSTPEARASEARTEGPNLKLLYCLIALALAAAIGLAAMIVLPFYRRQ
jgi:hypothetical protein